MRIVFFCLLVFVLSGCQRSTNEYVVRSTNAISGVVESLYCDGNTCTITFDDNRSITFYGVPSKAIPKGHYVVFTYKIISDDSRKDPRFEQWVLTDTEVGEKLK